MSDVTDAPTQDAIAESLLPPEEQTAVEPVAEQQAETQVEEQPVEQTEQPESPEVAEDWLPSDQDKVFPDEVYARYGQRYNLSPEQAADPLVRQLLHDKINSDIFIQQQQEQQQFATEQVEEPTPAQEQAQPQLTREQYFQQLDQVIAQNTDPNVAKEFYTGFMKVFGVPDAEIAKNAAQAMPFTQLMSKYALNLINTFVPQLMGSQLQSLIGQTFPGFGEMYERSSFAMAWDRVRNSNPAFTDLPAYGTKQFSQQLREASRKIPGFDEMQFTGPDGRALPPMENSMRKYGMLAQAIKGQVDPRLLQQAAAAQNRNQRRAEVRRSAGNLGSGQSSAASGTRNSSQFQSNDDIFDQETMDRYRQEHGRL